MLNVLDMGVISAKNRMYKFFKEEKGEVNIVTIVILIGIAVALAVTFKESITTLVTGILEKVTTSANEAAGVN